MRGIQAISAASRSSARMNRMFGAGWGGTRGGVNPALPAVAASAMAAPDTSRLMRVGRHEAPGATSRRTLPYGPSGAAASESAHAVRCVRRLEGGGFGRSELQRERFQRGVEVFHLR